MIQTKNKAEVVKGIFTPAPTVQSGSNMINSLLAVEQAVIEKAKRTEIDYHTNKTIRKELADEIVKNSLDSEARIFGNTPKSVIKELINLAIDNLKIRTIVFPQLVLKSEKHSFNPKKETLDSFVRWNDNRDMVKIEKLVDAILTCGFLPDQPIKVWINEDGKKELLDGHRRFTAIHKIHTDFNAIAPFTYEVLTFASDAHRIKYIEIINTTAMNWTNNQKAGTLVANETIDYILHKNKTAKNPIDFNMVAVSALKFKGIMDDSYIGSPKHLQWIDELYEQNEKVLKALNTDKFKYANRVYQKFGAVIRYKSHQHVEEFIDLLEKSGYLFELNKISDMLTEFVNKK